MKKGTKVSWQVPGAAGPGNGIVIADEDNTGHVPVAVESLVGEGNPGWHPLIWCSVTWLKAIETPAESQPTPPQPS